MALRDHVAPLDVLPAGEALELELALTAYIALHSTGRSTGSLKLGKKPVFVVWGRHSFESVCYVFR